MEKTGNRKAAERAQLTYVSDSEPGIRRKGAPKRFWYVGPNGERVKEGETVRRIRALAIPPAWTDVWIAPDPNGHIQATGRDQKGRKQYRYHPDWAAERDGEKYSSLIQFAEALPGLRDQVDADLRRHGLPFERVVAAVVWLLDNTMIRVGNPVKRNIAFAVALIVHFKKQIDDGIQKVEQVPHIALHRVEGDFFTHAAECGAHFAPPFCITQERRAS